MEAKDALAGAEVTPVSVGAANSTCEELLQLVAEQDREAFAELYDLTSHRLYGLALRVLCNAALAEEAVQETYLAIWQEAGSCDTRKGKAFSWMLTICHRRCVDRVRSEESRRKRDALYGLKESATLPSEPQETVELRLAAQAVHGALDELSQKQTEVIEQVYFQGCTVQEAADSLSIPLGTAKTRLRDGLANLRKEMRKHATM